MTLLIPHMWDECMKMMMTYFVCLEKPLVQNQMPPSIFKSCQLNPVNVKVSEQVVLRLEYFKRL